MKVFNILIDDEKVQTVSTEAEAISFVLSYKGDLPVVIQKVENLVLDFHRLKLVNINQ